MSVRDDTAYMALSVPWLFLPVGVRWQAPWARPTVPWNAACPDCGGEVVVRHVPGRAVRFWTCTNSPACAFASWRPRALWDCAACGGAQFWSHSRKSVSCSACGTRAKVVRHAPPSNSADAD